MSTGQCSSIVREGWFSQVDSTSQCPLPWAGVEVNAIHSAKEVILPGVPEPTIFISLKLMAQFNMKSFAKESYL